jgi:hypothetical protein
MPSKPNPPKRQTADQLKELSKVGLYGLQGGGKTTDVASMAKLGKIVLINAESGLKPKTLARSFDIPVANISIHSDISYEGLDALYWELKAEFDDDPDAYIGLGLDSVTEIQKLMLERLVDAGKIKADRKGMVREGFQAQRDEYGEVTEQLRRLIRKFRDLPCHVAIAALERRDQDDDGTVKYGPAVTPAIQNDLVGYLDILCHVVVEVAPGWNPVGEAFIGQFRRGGKYNVKERFNLIPARLINPTMDRIIAYVNEDLVESEDDEQIKWAEWVKENHTEKELDIGALLTGANPMKKAATKAVAKSSAVKR